MAACPASRGAFLALVALFCGCHVAAAAGSGRLPSDLVGWKREASREVGMVDRGSNGVNAHKVTQFNARFRELSRKERLAQENQLPSGDEVRIPFPGQGGDWAPFQMQRPVPQEQTQPQPEPQPQPQPEVQTQPQPEAQPQPQPEAQPEAQQQTEPQPQAESQPQPETEAAGEGAQGDTDAVIDTDEQKNFSADLPDPEAEKLPEGDTSTSTAAAAAAADPNAFSSQVQGVTQGAPPFDFDALGRLKTANPQQAQVTSSPAEGEEEEYPFAREAELEAAAAAAALAGATTQLGRPTEVVPHTEEISAVEASAQEAGSAESLGSVPGVQEATAEAAAAAAAGDPSAVPGGVFSVDKLASNLGIQFNFSQGLNLTQALNLPGKLNVTEGVQRIQTGDFGPEAVLAAVFGAAVGMFVCVFCMCLCCRKRVQYKPIRTSDIEL